MDLLSNRFSISKHQSLLRHTACEIYSSTNANLVNYDMHSNENITDQIPTKVTNHKISDCFVQTENK